MQRKMQKIMHCKSAVFLRETGRFLYQLCEISQFFSKIQQAGTIGSGLLVFSIYFL